MSLGQINLGSTLGDYISSLAKLPEVQTVVEVGAWNGLGSTRCVLDGLAGKEDYLFKSYECNLDMYVKAVGNNNLNANFQIIHGKLVEERDITDWFDINTLTAEQLGWLKGDLHWMSSSPNVFHTIPEKIDLLILDGGEFSTYKEWLLLKDRVTYVVLDDVLCLKTKRIRQELLGTCEILLDCLTERNGFFIGKIK